MTIVYSFNVLVKVGRDKTCPCTVVVPECTSKIKCDAILGYGAELVFCDNNLKAR